jgi:membrane protease subunit (stomatin/prohibitin family)
LSNFSIQSLNTIENDLSIVKIKTALAKRAEIGILDVSYLQDQNIEILKSAASNPGVAGGVLGVGLGMNIGAALGPIVSDASSNVFSRNSMGGDLKSHTNGNIHSEKNTKLSTEEKIELLKRLGELKAAGILTDDEFMAEKKRVLEI